MARNLCLAASRFLGFAAVVTFLLYVIQDMSGRTISFPYIPIAIALFILGVVFAVIEQKLFEREPIQYKYLDPDDPNFPP
jgi:hypothetical protein